MGDIIKLSALALGEKIGRGEMKIAEVLDAVYKSEEENRRLNCFITLCRERAYEKGAEIQRRLDVGEYISPLAGVPIGIKDNIAVEGVKMTCGSRILEDYVPPVSAANTARANIGRFPRKNCAVSCRASGLCFIFVQLLPPCQ